MLTNLSLGYGMAANNSDFDGTYYAVTEEVMGVIDIRLRLISEDVYNKLVLIWPLLWLLILPLGVWANGLNIRTFLRMGLEDSVTISFFFLAVLDLAEVFFALPNIVLFFLIYLEKTHSIFMAIQPFAVFLYVANIGVLFNMWTSFITAFLSVQRCLCILMPLHFKNVFTKTRSWGIMALFGVYSSVPVALYLFVTYEIRRLEVAPNTTQYAIHIMPIYRHVQKYCDIVMYMATNLACQVLSFGSLIIMGHSLAASVKFRKSATTSSISTSTPATSHGGKQRKKKKNGADGDQCGGAGDNDDDTPDDVNVNVKIQAAGDKRGGDKPKQSSKERTAVVQVSLLAAIFLATRLPQIGFSIASFTIFDFGVNKPLNNLYMFIFLTRLTSDYVNSAVNILVYYKYNSRFRKLCFSSGKQEAM